MSTSQLNPDLKKRSSKVARKYLLSTDTWHHRISASSPTTATHTSTHSSRVCLCDMTWHLSDHLSRRTFKGCPSLLVANESLIRRVVVVRRPAHVPLRGKAVSDPWSSGQGPRWNNFPKLMFIIPSTKASSERRKHWQACSGLKIIVRVRRKQCKSGSLVESELKIQKWAETQVLRVAATCETQRPIFSNKHNEYLSSHNK